MWICSLITAVSMKFRKKMRTSSRLLSINNRLVLQLFPGKSMGRTGRLSIGTRELSTRSTFLAFRLSADNKPRETLEQLRHCASWTGARRCRNNHRLQREAPFVIRVTRIVIHPPRSKFVVALCSGRVPTISDTDDFLNNFYEIERLG